MEENLGTPENENQPATPENTPDQPQGAPTPSGIAAAAEPSDDREPSHVAVGVGVIDGDPIDGPTTMVRTAVATP